MSVTTASRSVLIAFEAFDRLVNRGRSIQVQHRDAYKALVAAVDVLRVTMEARPLDGESAPEYGVKGTYADKTGTYAEKGTL